MHGLFTYMKPIQPLCLKVKPTQNNALTPTKTRGPMWVPGTWKVNNLATWSLGEMERKYFHAMESSLWVFPVGRLLPSCCRRFPYHACNAWDWYIYIYIYLPIHEWWIFYGFHVGKYTVRPMDFLWVNSTLNKPFPEVEHLAPWTVTNYRKGKTVFQQHHFSGELLMDLYVKLRGCNDMINCFCNPIPSMYDICTSINQFLW